MDIKWILDFISLPFLLVPAVLIFGHICIHKARYYLEKQRVVRGHLNFFEMILDYEVGAPSDQEIEKLREELEKKSIYLKKMTYEQINLGHKKVISLSKHLRHQQDMRDNEAVLRLKDELKEVIMKVRRDDVPII